MLASTHNLSIAEELGSRRPAIFYIQNDYGENYARTTAELLRRYGIEPILLAHTQGDNDLLPQVRSALDRGADALVSAGYVRDTALVLKARRATGSRSLAPKRALPATVSLRTALSRNAEKSAIVSAFLDRVNSGAEKISAVETDTCGWITAYQRTGQ